MEQSLIKAPYMLIVKNQHHFNRYLRFIVSRPARSKPRKHFSGLHGHHIVPKAVGGTDDADNIVYLTYREHYLAHWMLAKALGDKMWYAFNVMASNGNINSTLYEQSRKYVSSLVSDATCGRIVYHHKETGYTKYFRDGDAIPAGYERGFSATALQKNSDGVRKLKFYHNPATKDQIRINTDEETAPIGYIPGRILGHETGLSAMNVPGRMNVYDMANKTRIYIPKEDYANCEYVTISPNNGIIVVIGDYIIESVKVCNLMLYPHIPKMTGTNYNKKWPTHHNMKKAAQIFTTKTEGKSFRELGFDFIRLDCYTDSVEGKTLVRKDNYGLHVDGTKRTLGII
jgi:hypothetical protein